ncbi:MAG: helix-turn-helix domain-containing protein [Eggerthellaceae bacterium]|nr:helix-turn-helix domain-containing protein [Eggerthellaceae bacterium]
MNAEPTAEEIREIRQQYGLSQKSFALLLGIGPASMVRYEQGSKPSKANANLIRAARHPQFMQECLERDGALLPEAQRVRASEVIYAVVSLEPEGEIVEISGKGNSAMAMNEMYELTLRQEILNEQAANIMGEIISAKVAGAGRGRAIDVYDALLSQVAEVKYAIIGLDDHEQLDAIEGYLRCAQDLVHRQLLEAA